MRICNNCNKEFDDDLCYCTFCGIELSDVKDSLDEENNTISKNNDAENTDVSENKEEKVLSEESQIFSEDNKMEQNKQCCYCKATIYEGEKFCYICGAAIQEEPEVPIASDKASKESVSEDNILETDLQRELLKVFRSNKFFKFILKYAAIFSFIYPIYLLLGNLNILNGIVNILEYISIFMFYGYYLALVALYSKRSYLPLLIALSLRFVNSLVVLLDTSTPIISITRMIVVVIAFIFVLKKFRKTEQYSVFKSKFVPESKLCPCCSTKIKSNDSFCSKCGNKIGE